MYSEISLNFIFLFRNRSTACSFASFIIAHVLVPFFAASYANERQGKVVVSGFSKVRVFNDVKSRGFVREGLRSG